MQINTVCERPRDLVHVFFYNAGSAHAFFLGMIVITARSPVHGRNPMAYPLVRPRHR